MLKGEHSAILLTFIKLPVVIKIFVLSIFEWLFYCTYLKDYSIIMPFDAFEIQHIWKILWKMEHLLFGENDSISIIFKIFSNVFKTFLNFFLFFFPILSN